MTTEREWPQWPWKEWGNIEPDKARLEDAVHRTLARQLWEEEMSWERCGWCRERRKMVPVDGSERRLPKTGRIRFEVRCATCGETSLRSRHPNPIIPPGLAVSAEAGNGF